jgi:NSS family neurotransmitter:Na+ symporter
MIVLSLPCALGFSLLSGFHPIREDWIVLDLEDFILSNNLLPLGALCYVLFCVSKKGWGWDNFIKEADLGEGRSFPAVIRPYLTWVVPILIVVVFVMGYYGIFFK